MFELRVMYCIGVFELIMVYRDVIFAQPGTDKNVYSSNQVIGIFVVILIAVLSYHIIMHIDMTLFYSYFGRGSFVYIFMYFFV